MQQQLRRVKYREKSLIRQTAKTIVRVRHLDFHRINWEELRKLPWNLTGVIKRISKRFFQIIIILGIVVTISVRDNINWSLFVKAILWNIILFCDYF